MPSLGPRADNSWSANEFESQAREDRKQRVISLLAEGLPVPQGRIFDLLRLLAQPVLDLNGITEIVRTEPLLNTHVEGLLSVLFLRRESREASGRPRISDPAGFGSPAHSGARMRACRVCRQASPG